MLANYNKSSNQGFTLIELLTSLAIASIIMILLLGLMSQSSSTYRSSQSAVNTLSESRAFFHFFEADLSSRLPITPLMSEESITNPDKIAFVRAQSYDEQVSPTEGDLRTSLYYVAYTADLAGAVSPKLFRRALNAKDTQALIESSNTPTIPVGNPKEDEPIVYNVLSFKVRPKQYSASGQPEPWTPTSTIPPALLEITLEITDDFSAGRFKTESSWSEIRNPANKKAREAVRSFTQTLILPQ